MQSSNEVEAKMLHLNCHAPACTSLPTGVPGDVVVRLEEIVDAGKEAGQDEGTKGIDLNCCQGMDVTI